MDESSAAEAFVQKYRWTWPSLADPDAELAGKLGLFGHPAVAVIDEAGAVVARHIGGGNTQTWEALAAKL